MRLILILSMLVTLSFSNACMAEGAVIDKAVNGVKKGGQAAGRGIEKGAEATGKGLKKASAWLGKKLKQGGDKSEKADN